MKHEQELNVNELLMFLKLIPENILSDCVDNIDFSNRSERRKYEKLKSLGSKIKALLHNKRYRIEMIENL